MNKLTFKKIILAYVMATISFVAMSQSTGLPLAKMSISKVEEKSYFDPKDLVSNYVSWGVNPTNPASINLLEAWKKFKKKKDIVVAVVDTGIDREHPFLEKNIFVENGKVDPNNFGVDFSKDKKSKGMPTDNHGHGTHVSGIIKSIFQKLRYWP
jgi:subtilisin family serine protease